MNGVIGTSEYVQVSGQHQWKTAPSGTAGDTITFTQAMTLDASGNLLVGKTATSFSTAGTVLYPNGTADFIANGDVAIDINRLVDDGALIRFYQAGTTVGSIGTTGGELYIDFGGSTGGAVTSRTLDDYEEGTWTPAITGATTAGTYVYEAARTGGRYTKIGRVVQVWGVIRISSITVAGTGGLNISGFPFTTGARLAASWGNSNDMQVDIYGSSGSSSTQTTYPPPLMGDGPDGSTQFSVRSYGKNEAVSTVIGDLTGADWIYQINGSYTVD
jgi:hypothetical protein